MQDDDAIGTAILPSELHRILGVRFISISQLAEKTNLNQKAATALIEALIEKQLFEEWLAPQCPHCRFIWPQYEKEEDVEPEVFCPMCNNTTPVEHVAFFKAYKAIKKPPWAD